MFLLLFLLPVYCPTALDVELGARGADQSEQQPTDPADRTRAREKRRRPRGKSQAGGNDADGHIRPTWLPSSWCMLGVVMLSLIGRVLSPRSSQRTIS